MVSGESRKIQPMTCLSAVMAATATSYRSRITPGWAMQSARTCCRYTTSPGLTRPE